MGTKSYDFFSAAGWVPLDFLTLFRAADLAVSIDVRRRLREVFVGIHPNSEK
jgi:hypothetical protein